VVVRCHESESPCETLFTGVRIEASEWIISPSQVVLVNMVQQPVIMDSGRPGLSPFAILPSVLPPFVVVVSLGNQKHP
jgi:hypothetical protein